MGLMDGHPAAAVWWAPPLCCGGCHDLCDRRWPLLTATAETHWLSYSTVLLLKVFLKLYNMKHNPEYTEIAFRCHHPVDLVFYIKLYSCFHKLFFLPSCSSLWIFLSPFFSNWKSALPWEHYFPCCLLKWWLFSFLWRFIFIFLNVISLSFSIFLPNPPCSCTWRGGRWPS